jgi:hypothetical protein
MRRVRLCTQCGKMLPLRGQGERHRGCPTDEEIVMRVEAAMDDPTFLAARTSQDFILPVPRGMITIIVQEYRELLPPVDVYIGTYGPFEITTVFRHAMNDPLNLMHVSITFQNTSRYSGIFFPAGTHVTREIGL